MQFEDKTLAAVVAACALGVGVGVVLVNSFGKVEPASRADAQPVNVQPASAPAPKPPQYGAGVVSEVHSGDSVTVEGVGRVRLLGVDASDIPGGKPDPGAAKAYLQTSIKGKEVFVTGDIQTADTDFKDENGTPLVYLLLDDGVLVNSELVARGAAVADIERQYTRRDEILRAERDARWNNRGVWDVASLKPLAPTDLDKAKKGQLPALEPAPMPVGRNDVLVTSDGRFHRGSCKLGKGGTVMSIDDARKKHYLACPACFASAKVKV